jgi:hypothetical protein
VQTDLVCSDLSNALDIVSNNLLLRILRYFGLSSGYVNCFHSYLTNRCVLSGLVGFLHFVPCEV